MWCWKQWIWTSNTEETHLLKENTATTWNTSRRGANFREPVTQHGNGASKYSEAPETQWWFHCQDPALELSASRSYTRGVKDTRISRSDTETEQVEERNRNPGGNHNKMSMKGYLPGRCNLHVHLFSMNVSSWKNRKQCLSKVCFSVLLVESRNSSNYL